MGHVTKCDSPVYFVCLLCLWLSTLIPSQIIWGMDCWNWRVEKLASKAASSWFRALRLGRQEVFCKMFPALHFKIDQVYIYREQWQDLWFPLTSLLASLLEARLTHIYTQLKIRSLLWFCHNHIYVFILTLTLFYRCCRVIFVDLLLPLYLSCTRSCSHQQHSWSCWLCWEKMWSSSYKMNERLSLETLLLASSQPKQTFLPLLLHLSSFLLHFCSLCAFLYHLVLKIVSISSILLSEYQMCVITFDVKLGGLCIIK